MSSSKQKNPDWLVPDYPPLKGEVGQAAVNGQIVHYPKVARTQTDPPIVNQIVGNISFMFFKEVRKLRNGKPVYGFFKLGGNWADEIRAKSAASKIIREVDSKHQVKLCPVGGWLPLTDESAFCREMLDVRMNKNEKHLRDQAVKDTLAKQNQMKREIFEREEELKHGGDIYDDPTTLDFYSMKRVTDMKLTEQIENYIKALENIRGKLKDTRRLLKKLEIKHPEYNDQWVECWNVNRRKAGIPDFIPGEDEFKEYEETVFDDLEDSDSENEDEDVKGKDSDSENENVNVKGKGEAK